jgi:NAD(P)-dependent dehydrogenase (short-subunit alcohol dehydrogenase family)
MSTRAAIVTGASRGIGRAIAEALGDEGHSMTITARTPDRLEATATAFRNKGWTVEAVPADTADEEGIKSVVSAHRRRFGRLDVLVNSAGVLVRAPVGRQPTELVDRELDVNLRAIILFYRESAEMLRAAGHEHGNALVVNLASIAGKQGNPRVPVYSATKAAVIGYTQAMNEALNADGVKSVALCPGLVDTDMTDALKASIDAAKMIKPRDIAEAVRFLLRLSPACIVPEIVFRGPGDAAQPPGGL